MIRFFSKHVGGALVAISVAVAVLVASAVWFVAAVLPSIRAEVDHLGDRTDAALSKGTSLEVRVSGLEEIRPQVEAALDRVDQSTRLISGALASSVGDIRSLVGSVNDLLLQVRETAAFAGEAAIAPLRATIADSLVQARQLLDAARDLFSKAQAGVRVDIGGRVDHEIHILGPALEDLDNALLLTRDTACHDPLLVICLT